MIKASNEIKPFTIMPNEMIDNPELDIYMLSILLVLYRFRNPVNNTCSPSYSDLAKYAKCCVRQAQDSIKQLEKMGFIQVCRHDSDCLHSYISDVYLLPSMKTILEPSQEIHHTVIDDHFCHTQISADASVQEMNTVLFESMENCSYNTTTSADELVQEMDNVWLFENKIADTDDCFSDRQNSNEAIQEIDESFLASSIIQSKEKQAELYRASRAHHMPPIKNYILKTYIQNNLSIILS